MSESAQTIVFYCVCVFMPLEIVPELLVRLQFAQHKFLTTNHGCLACDMVSENWRLNDGVVVANQLWRKKDMYLQIICYCKFLKAFSRYGHVALHIFYTYPEDEGR